MDASGSGLVCWLFMDLVPHVVGSNPSHNYYCDSKFVRPLITGLKTHLPQCSSMPTSARVAGGVGGV